jgi:hypothetical protein
MQQLSRLKQCATTKAGCLAYTLLVVMLCPAHEIPDRRIAVAVTVLVGVLERFVRMSMLVSLRQVQPDTDGHLNYFLG